MAEPRGLQLAGAFKSESKAMAKLPGNWTAREKQRKVRRDNARSLGR